MIKQSNPPHKKYPSISLPLSTLQQTSASSTTLPTKRNPLRFYQQQNKTKRQSQRTRLHRTTSRMIKNGFSQNKSIFKDIRYIRAQSIKNNELSQQNMQNFKQQKCIEYHNNQYDIGPNVRTTNKIVRKNQKNRQNRSSFINKTQQINPQSQKQYNFTKTINLPQKTPQNNQHSPPKSNNLTLQNKQNININKIHLLLKILEEQKFTNKKLTKKLEQYSKQITLLKKQLSNKQYQICQKNQEIRNMKNFVQQNQYCVKINNMDRETKRKLSHNRNPSDPLHILKPNLSQNPSLAMPIPINISSHIQQLQALKKEIETSKIQSENLLDSQERSNIQKFVDEHLQINNQKQLSGIMMFNINDISSMQGDQRQNKRTIKILTDQLKYKDIEICMLKKTRDEERKQFILKQKLLKMLMTQLNDIKTKLYYHNCDNETALRQIESDVTLQYSIQ